eukprot:snap_masked-scaffold_4-processed-gene-7.21-mRNA-1 protein AED:1.00 eAED:1.00 QI:0/-1/0/0/-1/1/1/0/125
MSVSKQEIVELLFTLEDGKTGEDPSFLSILERIMWSEDLELLDFFFLKMYPRYPSHQVLKTLLTPLEARFSTKMISALLRKILMSTENASRDLNDKIRNLRANIRELEKQKEQLQRGGLIFEIPR